MMSFKLRNSINGRSFKQVAIIILLWMFVFSFLLKSTGYKSNNLEKVSVYLEVHAKCHDCDTEHVEILFGYQYIHISRFGLFK